MYFNQKRYEELIAKEKRYELIRSSISASQTIHTEEAKDFDGNIIMRFDTGATTTILFDPRKILQNCNYQVAEDVEFEFVSQTNVDETGVL